MLWPPQGSTFAFSHSPPGFKTGVDLDGHTSLQIITADPSSLLWAKSQM